MSSQIKISIWIIRVNVSFGIRIPVILVAGIAEILVISQVGGLAKIRAVASNLARTDDDF